MSGSSSKQKFVRSVADMKEELPQSLEALYPIADVKNSNDALVLVLHTFMLEVGFIPKDVPENEKLKLLPRKWHDNGVYRIAYYHLTCPELTCLMTCVPLGHLLSIFGTVDDISEFQEPTLCLQVNNHINSRMGFSDMSKVFSDVKELSRIFKDNFAYTLLAAMQEAVGFGPTFGLPAAVDHVKVQILSYLPLGSLIAMSSVNKEFNALCNAPSLWKKLYLKDISVGLIDSEEMKQVGWKEMYKKKYLMEKKINASHLVLPAVFPGFRFYPHFWPPRRSCFGAGPGFPMIIPDEVRTAFPQLGRRSLPQQLSSPLNPPVNIPGAIRFI